MGFFAFFVGWGLGVCVFFVNFVVMKWFRFLGRRVLLVSAVVFGYSIVFQLFYNWMRYLTPWPYVSGEQVWVSALMNFGPIWVLSMLIWFVVCGLRSPRGIGLKIFTDVVLTAAAMVAVNYGFEFVTGASVEWGGTAFNATFLLLGFLTYFFVVKYLRMIEQEAEAREDALRYRYDALRAQIDPHFLFNSLNILSSLIVVDPDASQDFIISLSRLYRYVMTKESKEAVSVDEELAFLRNYVDILVIRYGHNLRVNVEVDGDVGERRLVPFTLQLLLENVIKHNVISSTYKMVVNVRVNDEGVVVENEVKMLKDAKRMNVGGRYLKKLYALHGGGFRAGMEGDRYVARLSYLQ